MATSGQVKKETRLNEELRSLERIFEKCDLEFQAANVKREQCRLAIMKKLDQIKSHRKAMYP